VNSLISILGANELASSAAQSANGGGYADNAHRKRGVMKLVQRGNNQEVEVEAERVGENRARVRVGARTLEIEFTRLADGTLLIRDGEQRHRVFAQQLSGDVFVAVGPHSFAFTPSEERVIRPRGAEITQPHVVAPMPGRVVKILVERETTVQRGQPLVVLEAMKMEVVLSAESAARVVSVRVELGAQVEAGSVLLELSPLLSAPTAENAAI
jgi:biotin carboxyl carrier protein